MASSTETVSVKIVVQEVGAAAIGRVDSAIGKLPVAAQKAATGTTTALARVDMAVGGTAAKFSALSGSVGTAATGMNAPLNRMVASTQVAGNRMVASTRLAGTQMGSSLAGGVARADMAGAVGTAGRGATTAAAVHGRRAGGTFGSSLMSGFMAVGIVSVVKKVLGSTVNAYTQTAVDVNKLKRLTGGTTEEASRLSTEMTLSGVATAKGTTAMQLFSKNLGNASTDGKKSAAMTKLLGKGFVDATGAVLPLTELMGPLADKFKAMPSGAEKTALALKLFGRSGTDMLPMLNKGSEGLALLAKKSDDMGLTLNDSAITAMGDAKSTTRDWQAAVKGVEIAIGGALMPVMTELTKFGTSYLIPFLSKAAGWFKQNADWAVPLVIGLAALWTSFKIGTGVMGAFDQVMKANIFVKIILGIAALVAGLMWAYKNVDWFRDAVNKAWAWIQMAFQKVMTVVGPIMTWFGENIHYVGDAAIWLWSNAIQPAWAAISAAVSWAWTTVISPVLGFIIGLVRLVGGAYLWLWTNVVQPVLGWIGQAISWVWVTFLQPILASWLSAIQKIGGVISWLWTTVVQPVFGWIGDRIKWVWDTFIHPVFSWISGATGDIGTDMNNLWANVIQPVWTWIGDKIHWVWEHVIKPAWDGIKGFVAGIGGFFGSIRDGVVGAVKWIGEQITKVIGAIDKFFNKTVTWDPAKIKAQMDAPGQQTSPLGGHNPTAAPATGNPFTHATGGWVNGPGGPTDDQVPILASNKEFVVRASAAQPNAGLLEAINAGRYAAGGWVAPTWQNMPAKWAPIQRAAGDTVGTDIAGTGDYLLEAEKQRILGTALAAAQAGAGGSSGPARDAFISALRTKLGTRYVWGAAGPDVFDCSGLMSWGLQQAGLNLGRQTAQGFNETVAHTTAETLGNMVTFDTGRLPGQAGHIGAIVDGLAGMMLHTDGAGPARISPYRGRDGGPLSILDPFGGSTGGAGGVGGGDPAQFGGLAVPGSGVERWRGRVLQSLGLIGQPGSMAGYVLNQISSESSGDQFAVNRTDSNAQAGHPSMGLVQVIWSTFQSELVKHGFGAYVAKGQFDPLANLMAGELWAIDQYGSIPAGMQGHAYDGGGLMRSGTGGFNASGHDELVLSPKQTAAVMSGSGGGVTVAAGAVQITVNGNLDNAGQVRADLERALREILSNNASRSL